MRLDEVAVELYALPQAEFTAARDARAAAMRRDGERELATQVRGLRRPTAAAWAVNQLVRAHPEEVDQLLELGDLLREAQESLAGEELRRLNRQQHQVVAALRRRAGAAAEAAGSTLSESVGRQVEATLRAGMADPAAAAAVRSGLLTANLESTGFAPVDLDGAVAVPSAGALHEGASGGGASRRADGRAADPAPERAAQGTRERRADRARQEEERRARERAEERRAAELTAARTALDDALRGQEQARSDLDTAEATVERLARRRAELEEEAEALRTRLADLEESAGSVGRDLTAARDARRSTARAATAADRAVDRARAHVDGISAR